MQSVICRHQDDQDAGDAGSSSIDDDKESECGRASVKDILIFVIGMVTRDLSRVEMRSILSFAKSHFSACSRYGCSAECRPMIVPIFGSILNEHLA